MSAKPALVGDIISVDIDRLAYGGEGVARHSGLVVFVKFSAPGDRLKVRITESKPTFARGVIEEILEPSPSRRAALCRYFGECGGCQLQHVEYAAQLAAKAGFIRDALQRVGGIDWPEEIPIRSSREYGYRTRAEFKIGLPNGAGFQRDRESGTQVSNNIAVGFHRAGSHSVCDITDCPVLVPELNEALSELRQRFKRASGSHTGAGGPLPVAVDAAAGASRHAFHPAIPGLPSEPLGIEVGKLNYRYSPSTFFQANQFLLEDMVECAVGGASADLAFDLYAGVGLFTLALAAKCGQVVGIESYPEAARLAVANAAANGVGNVRFESRSAEAWGRSYAAEMAAGRASAPDLILLDPPRGGAEGALKHLIQIAPRNITYVSCNPPTLARDLAKLIKAGYSLNSITGFDLFPQTFHVETVAKLENARHV